MSTTLLVLLLCAPAESPADTVVVCPQEFQQGLVPWLDHRRALGHRVAVISNMKTATELRADVRRIARAGALRYVLLVGDADPAMTTDPVLRKRSVPTHHAEAVVNVQFGSEPEIATDNWYADLDDDRVPDVAVGRLTCDSAAELSRIVQKILNYETSTDFGPWRRQVNFVAGLGGFGAMADAVMEAAAKSLIREGVPSSYSTTMTYGSWQSPYCPDPRQFERVTVERLNEGSLFWVYIGHGQQRSVDNVHVPGAAYPILTSPDMAQLACRHGAPIACFLACYAGAFDQRRDCLAEEMLRSSGGPVAVLCGSRVTMPYAMSVMGSELLRACFVEHCETLGDAMLSAKRRMVQSDHPSRLRLSLDAAARALSPTAGQLEAERAEHLDLFNLLGDPLLRLPHPRPIQVEAPPTALAGQEISISIDSSVAGAGTLELAVRRDRLTFQPPRRPAFDSADGDGYMETYQRANEPRLATVQVNLRPGPLIARLNVPAEARGACHVRVFVEGADGCAAGAADIRIEALQTPAPQP
jgi:hypothetical protein